MSSRRKKIAAVVTTWYTNSHADVVIGKFIRGAFASVFASPAALLQGLSGTVLARHAGFPTDEGLLPPEVDIVSCYMDQLSTKDTGIALLRRHGIRICSTINEALMLDEGKLAVDGVLSIGEHGSYAHNELGQHMCECRHLFNRRWPRPLHL